MKHEMLPTKAVVFRHRGFCENVGCREMSGSHSIHVEIHMLCASVIRMQSGVNDGLFSQSAYPYVGIHLRSN